MDTETIKILLQVLTLIVTSVGAFLAYREFKKSKKLNEIDKFIKYREKLKTDESLKKIVTHIQNWQNNPEQKSQIPKEITLFDFYYFLGFYEELYILIQNSHLDKRYTKDMFAFYAFQIADNQYYWEQFNENYHTDGDWKNFRYFVELMRSSCHHCSRKKWI